MKELQIVLADDHQMFRDGIRAVLAEEEHIHVAGEVGDGAALFDLLATVHPDLVITDIHMPGMSGIEIAEKIKAGFPDIKVLMLSMHTQEEFITKALNVGADGYLPKDTSMTELLDAIKTICQGENYFNKSNGVCNHDP
jgi:DNA-binding NarL/FixJ family response regulator